MTRKPIFGGFMVYVMDFSAMTDEEKAVAVCLQGIVNRSRKSIVFDADNYMSYVSDTEQVRVDAWSTNKRV